MSSLIQPTVSWCHQQSRRMKHVTGTGCSWWANIREGPPKLGADGGQKSLEESSWAFQAGKWIAAACSASMASVQVKRNLAPEIGLSSAGPILDIATTRAQPDIQYTCRHCVATTTTLGITTTTTKMEERGKVKNQKKQSCKPHDKGCILWEAPESATNFPSRP